MVNTGANTLPVARKYIIACCHSWTLRSLPPDLLDPFFERVLILPSTMWPAGSTEHYEHWFLKRCSSETGVRI